MAKKRILMLVENLPVPFDRRVWMEATTLARAGYGVAVICPQGKYPRRHEVLDDISIYRFPLPSLGGIAGHLLEYSLALPWVFALSWVVLLREGFDAIHSANPPDFFFLIGAFFKLLGKKFVFDHHDLVPESCETRWTGARLALMRSIALWAERATFRTADRVVSTNQSYRQVALSRGRVPPERAFVVRSAPSVERFVPAPPDPALKDGRPYLVAYLGVMGPNDGLDLLLCAIAHIAHRLHRRDIRFVLIGGGDLQPQLVRKSAALNLADTARFAGRIPDDQVIALLSTADLCVAPDPRDPANDLSTMNKIVEYMALGRPIVAFDLREARVSAGDAAVYAAANDPLDFARCIVELLADPERRRSMGVLGRRRFLEELAWEHQRANLLALYRGLLADPVHPKVRGR